MVLQGNDRRKLRIRILSIVACSLSNPPPEHTDFVITERVRIHGHTLFFVIRRDTVKELSLEVSGLELLPDLPVGIKAILSFCFSLLVTPHALPLQNRSHLSGKTDNFCRGQSREKEGERGNSSLHHG
tara:strand:- start:438 stop:821 length:384 start_codon:yes stop_codon:yes gene_type:complete